MRSRRVARERALQFLFQYDVNRPDDVSEALESFWDDHRKSVAARNQKSPTFGEQAEPVPVTAGEAASRAFADSLIRGTLDHLDEVDREIESRLTRWRVDRIARDRIILRLGVYEILRRPDIPPVVSINEMVELAKKYSTEDSGKFVNGILDGLCKDVARPARSPMETA